MNTCRIVMQFSGVPPFSMCKIRHEHGECHTKRVRSQRIRRYAVSDRERIDVRSVDAPTLAAFREARESCSLRRSYFRDDHPYVVAVRDIWGCSDSRVAYLVVFEGPGGT